LCWVCVQREGWRGVDHQGGRIVVPEDAEPGTFILSDGKLARKAGTPPPGPSAATIGDLVDAYDRSLPAGAKEANSQ
jgi:hypothetical protein